jgi:alkanesulfonate monooxygenase SsuD/methylene tetrahydromethanopterin reductase-like flavin-dependent oxidoreductase (luciferase family)
MKIGLQIPCFNWPGSPENIGLILIEIFQAADQGGVFSLWVMGHFFGLGGVWGPVDGPMLEGYTSISYLVAVTEKIRLGVMVTGAYHRYPGVLVKKISTLDVLSGDRAYLGIGAGWNDHESKAIGIPFPATVRERMERLEETL